MDTKTTIKVAPEVRERLERLALAEGVTAGRLVEKLVHEYLWRKEVDHAKNQMRNTSAQVWQDYLDESAAWDSLTYDGLDRR